MINGRQFWLSVFLIGTLNTETIPSDSSVVTACLISSVLMDGKVNELSLDLQQVPASCVFQALSLSPVHQLVTRYYYVDHFRYVQV